MGLKSYWTNFKKRIATRKSGMTSIEVVVGTMIFMFLFCAIADLMVLSNRYAVLSDTGKELARTISVQGGANYASKPAGYTANYYTMQSLATLTKLNLESAGFKNGDWIVNIRYNNDYSQDNRGLLTGETVEDTHNHIDEAQTLFFYDSASDKIGMPSEDISIEYLHDFTVTIDAQYDWPFITGLLPKFFTKVRVTMPGTSEWKSS